MATGSFGLGWRQVGCAFVLLACTASITSAYSVVAVPLAAEFKPSRAVLALAMTMVSAVSALLAPFVGSLMDRTSLRRLMMIGGCLLGLGFTAVSLARSFNEVLLGYGLLIAPASVMLGPLAVTVLLSRWFVMRRGTALGIAIAGISMGGVIVPPLTQTIMVHFPWRDALRVLALLFTVSTLLAAFLVVNQPADRGLHPDGANSDPAAKLEATPPEAGWRTVRRILGDPSFWLIALMLAAVTAGMKGMVTSLALIGKTEGVAPTAAALLISIYASGSFVAKLSFAAIADRINLRYLAATSLLGFVAGFLLLAQADRGYAFMAAGVGLTGLFGGLMIPLESMLGARVFGRQAVGRAVGLLTMATLIALLMAPPFFGKVFDLTGSYDWAFYGFAGLALLATLVVPFVRLHPREVVEAGRPMAA